MSREFSLKQLRSFVAVAEELNFRRAAARLFITQPPLSRQIRRLEELLKSPLFVRDRQGVLLTEEGRRFLEKARLLLEHSCEVFESVRSKAPMVRASLRVGVTVALDPDFFSAVGQIVESRFPSSEIMIKRQISIRCIKDVFKGVLDLALIGTPADMEGMLSRQLCKDPLVVAMSTSHPLASRRQVSLTEIQQDTLFWFDRKLNPAFYDHCERGFRRFGFSPERAPEPAEHHVLLAMVAAGQGVALIPGSLRAVRRKNVVYKTIKEASYFQIGVAAIWRENAPEIVELVNALAAHYEALLR